jgi:hypothetical protein
LKELNEANIALEITKRSEMLKSKTVEPVQKEFSQLQRIIGASIRTAEGRKK